MPIPVLAFPDKKRKKGKEKKYLQLRYTAPALKRIGEAPRRGVDKGAKGKKSNRCPIFSCPLHRVYMNGECNRLDSILSAKLGNSLNTTFIPPLLNFNTTVDLPNKQPTREKPNGTCQNKEQETNESAVT
jgi:hypothetical protein